MINPDTRFSSSVAQQSKSGLGRLSGEVSKPRTIIHKNTHTCARGINPLNDSPVFHRGHYLSNAQQAQKTNSHALIGVRTRDPRNKEATDLCHRRHGHRAWRCSIYLHIFTARKVSLLRSICLSLQ